MKQSDLNHLRRLLGWIGTKIRQEGPTAKPSGAAETYASRLRSAMTHRKIGISTLAAATGMHYQGVKQAIEGKSKSLSAANNVKAARFLEISPHWLATGQGAMLVPDATVPAYVVDAVKTLEGALSNRGPHRGVDAARATAETRAVIDVAPGAAGGPALPLSDLAMEQGLAEVGITVWGPRAEDWAAGAEYAVRLMRECLPKAAAETLPDRPGAAGNPAACRDTPAAPPTLRRDEGGGVGAARWSAPALRTQVERKTAGQVAEQEIDAIMEQAQVFASAWAFLGGPFDNGSGLEQAERERSNLRAMLSKLRAEGVQAGDERAEFVGWLTSSYPDAYSEAEAVRLWHHEHISALAWEERARRAALASAPVAGEAQRHELAVWYGSMPESNGKSNWTAILHRKGDGLLDGPHITIDRSEYPDRVRYEADRVRYIIGEIDKEPWILDYDADKCDAAPQASEAVDDNEREPSLTAGMNLGQRIAHVGGRTNAQGYIEFGSPMAVNALIQHVLRDLPARHRAAEDAKAWVDLFWSVAKELNCLPSSFVDGNEHVLRTARQARAAMTAQKSEGEAC